MVCRQVAVASQGGKPHQWCRKLIEPLRCTAAAAESSEGFPLVAVRWTALGLASMRKKEFSDLAPAYATLVGLKQGH